MEVPAGPSRAQVTAVQTVRNPARWEPNGSNGHGGDGVALLYTLHLSLYQPDQPVDRRFEKIGLRTIDLVREPDGDGKGKIVQVPGERP